MITKSEVIVPRQCVGAIIGKGGATLKRIAAETNTKIVFKSDDNDPDGTESTIVLVGTQADINNATEWIISLVERCKPTHHMALRFLDIRVPSHRTGLIIGRGGETIRQIINDSGAHVELRRGHDPTARPDETTFDIRGTPLQINHAKHLISIKAGQIPQNSPIPPLSETFPDLGSGGPSSSGTRRPGVLQSLSTYRGRRGAGVEQQGGSSSQAARVVAQRPSSPERPPRAVVNTEPLGRWRDGPPVLRRRTSNVNEAAQEMARMSIDQQCQQRSIPQQQQQVEPEEEGDRLTTESAAGGSGGDQQQQQPPQLPQQPQLASRRESQQSSVATRDQVWSTTPSRESSQPPAPQHATNQPPPMMIRMHGGYHNPYHPQQHYQQPQQDPHVQQAQQAMMMQMGPTPQQMMYPMDPNMGQQGPSHQQHQHQQPLMFRLNPPDQMQMHPDFRNQMMMYQQYHQQRQQQQQQQYHQQQQYQQQQYQQQQQYHQQQPPQEPQQQYHQQEQQQPQQQMGAAPNNQRNPYANQLPAHYPYHHPGPMYDPRTGQLDYSIQWMEYYRSIGSHDQAAAIEHDISRRNLYFPDPNMVQQQNQMQNAQQQQQQYQQQPQQQQAHHSPNPNQYQNPNPNQDPNQRY